MLFNRKLIFLLCFILSLQIIDPAKNREPRPKFLIRPNSVFCEFDNRTVLLKYCNLKPYSRYLVTLNLGFQFLVALKKPFYIQILIYYRYGTIFRQVIDTKQNEWCTYMEGTGINPLTKAITEYINMTYPQLIHKCPYEGDFDLFNYTMSAALPLQSQIFPQGYYKLVVFCFKNDVAVLTLKISGEMTSTIKETFG